MKTLTHHRALILITLLLLTTATMGARGDGCAAGDDSPAPDVQGTWDITYENNLDVTIKIGGATYTESLGAQGGVITLDHEGTPFTFDLACERPEVICPSEAWPASVRIEQRNDDKEHQMIVLLPSTVCDGNLVEPEECGADTINPECDRVCEGDVLIQEQERFGVIGHNGDTFRLYLGAGIASNGINCLLLGASVADAELVNIGTSEGGDWEAVAMENGVVKTAYAGGCLWAGDPDMDNELEALVLSASIEFETSFSGTKR